MAALSEEEKQEIIEEERVRAEARQQFEQKPPAPNEQIKGKPRCQVCGGAMKKKREVTGQGAGCLLILIGLVLVFLFPIGTVIGAFLILGGIVTSSKRRGLWVCRECGHKIERQFKWYEFGG